MLCKKFWPSIFLNKSKTVGKCIHRRKCLELQSSWRFPPGVVQKTLNVKKTVCLKKRLLICKTGPLTFERIALEYTSCFGSNLTQRHVEPSGDWFYPHRPTAWIWLPGWPQVTRKYLRLASQPGYDRGNYTRTKVFPIVFNKSSTIWKVFQTGSNAIFTFIGWCDGGMIRVGNQII